MWVQSYQSSMKTIMKLIETIFQFPLNNVIVVSNCPKKSALDTKHKVYTLAWPSNLLKY